MSAAARIAVFAARRRRLAPVSWGLSLGALGALTVAVFPSIRGSAQLDELIRSYPEALRQAFGISAGTYQSVQGYLNAELFSLVLPLATAWFMIHGLALAVCGAERRGTLDVVLAAPIRRREYVAGWLGGMTAALAGLLLVLAAVVELTAAAVGAGLPVGDLLAAVAGLVPLTVFFGGVTLLVAGVSDRAVVVTSVAAGVLALMYFVHVLSALSDAIHAVDPLSAFHYYGAAIQDGLDPVRAGGLLAAGIVLAAAGALLLERRDIRS